MKKAFSKTYRITVALRMAGIAGQDKLNGIFDHLSGGRRWQLSIYRRSDYRTPLEEGTPFSRGSLATAWRSARAKLLKMPSQTWCVSSP